MNDKDKAELCSILEDVADLLLAAAYNANASWPLIIGQSRPQDPMVKAARELKEKTLMFQLGILSGIIHDGEGQG